MSSAIDLEFGTGAQAAPHSGVFLLAFGQKVFQWIYDGGLGGSDSALPVREVQLDRPPSMRWGSDNIELSLRNVSDTAGDQPTQAGQLPSQAETQTRAYFFTISDIIGLTNSKSITADNLVLHAFLATPSQALHLSKILKNHGS